MAKLCPECGIDLTNKNTKTHAYTHWGVRVEDAATLPPEAKKRYLQITEAV